MIKNILSYKKSSGDCSCLKMMFYINFNSKVNSMLVRDQVQKSFRGSKENVEVEMILAKENQSPLLLIQITNRLKRVRYNMQIDRSYIQKQGQSFTMTIRSIQDLYDALVDDFDQLVITEDGCIQLELHFVIRKQVSTKLYRFQGLKEIMTQETQQYIRIKQLNEELVEKDRRIDQISRNYQELSTSYENIKTQLDEFKKSYQVLTDNACLMRQEITTLKEQLLKSKTPMHIDNVSTIRSQSPSRSNSYQGRSLSSNIHLKSVFYNFPLKLHSQSLKGDLFRTQKRSNNMTIIKKKDNYTYDNYVCNQPLPEGKTSTFRMKQIKTQDKDILFGIGCISAINVQNAHTSKETVSYYSSDGSIFVNSTPQQGGVSLEDGHKLIMLVDLVNWKIDWIIDGTRTASVAIPEFMRGQRLYVFVMMAYEGDTVMLSF